MNVNDLTPAEKDNLDVVAEYLGETEENTLTAAEAAAAETGQPLDETLIAGADNVGVMQALDDIMDQ